MKPRRKWFTWGLMPRLFVMTATVSIAVLAVMALYSYNSTHSAIERQISSNISSLNDRTLSYLDGYIESVQSLGRMIAMDSQKTITHSERIGELIDTFSRNIYPVARTIYFLPVDGGVISNRQVYYDVMGNAMLPVLAETARESLIGLAWSQPYHSPVSGDTIAFSLVVADRLGSEMGVLAIELDLGYIKNDLDRLLHKGEQSYLLMTSEGNVILFNRNTDLLEYENDALRTSISSRMVAQLAESPPGVSHLRQGGDSLLIARSQLNRLGWSLFTLVKNDSIFTYSKALTETYVNAGIVILVVLLGACFFLSRRFVAPIRELDDKMSRFSKVQLNEPLPVTRTDEIGHLTESYNQMLMRLNRVIEEIKQSEQEKQHYKIQMLQSQIKPHFLYNTLACVSSLAKQNRMEEIRRTISSMVGLLAYTFDKTDDFVTIDEEIQALRMYVQIQHMRYGNIFAVQYEIGPDSGICRCPKLTLQPVVENAVFHGILPTGRAGIIRVKTALEGETLHINIQDDGIGFDAQRFQKILAGIEQDSYSNSFNHVGLKNVHNRIVLNYGEEYGLTLLPQEKGTRIQISLPAHRSMEPADLESRAAQSTESDKSEYAE